MANTFQKNSVSDLPISSGVYQFLDNFGEILYIGKAKNLRARVRSYFLDECFVKGRSQWVFEMVKQVVGIKTFETDSEIEAVLLEAELINKIKPKYNTRQKDDKSYSVIEISKENIPKVEIRRVKNINLKDKNYYYFGPFTSGEILKRAMRILRKIFPYANCSKTKFNRQKKIGQACLYGDINLCPSPCVSEEKTKEAKKQIKLLRFFLSGKKKKIILDFEKEMKVLSRNKKYEDAAKIRDKIYALNHLNRYSVGVKDSYLEILDNSIFPRIEAYDISNIVGDFAVGAMTVLSLGKIDKSEYKKFKIKTVIGSNDFAMMQEIIIRRLKNNWQKPDLIVIDGGATHLKVATAEIEKSGLEIPVVAIAKGLNRKEDELYFLSTDLAKVFQKNPELKNLAIIARDEAHRFSQSYYQKLHRKSIILIE